MGITGCRLSCKNIYPGRAVPLDEYLFFSYTSFNTNKFLQQESRFDAHI
jgi:hypothetical protein